MVCGKYPVFPMFFQCDSPWWLPPTGLSGIPCAWFSLLWGSTIFLGTIPQAHRLLMRLTVYFAIHIPETQLAFHF